MGQLSGLAPGNISWISTNIISGGVTYLAVFGGSGGNTFTVADTAHFAYPIDLHAGAGNDIVRVNGTSGGLNIYNDGDNDQVQFSNNGSVQNIRGNVTVGGNAGATTLTVDDSADSTGRSFSLLSGRIVSLAPANISWSDNGIITYLALYAGRGGNNISVFDTSNFYYSTDLHPGTGTDTVNVLGTTGRLGVYNDGGSDQVYVTNNGSAQNIRGAVTVGGSGATQLAVEDQADTTGRSPTLSNGQLSNLAPANIFWTPTSSATGGVTYLAVYGGKGGNNYTVANTSNFYFSTDLRTGTGNDTINVLGTGGALNIINDAGSDSVYVGSRGSLLGGNTRNIQGTVSVSGSGATALIVDDGSDTVAHSAVLYNGAITGLAPANIIWTPTSNSTGGVVGIAFFGGSGGNIFTVTNTSNLFYSTALHTGTGGDSVYIGTATGRLAVINDGGSDSFNVGKLSASSVGNTSTIAGAISFSGKGQDALLVDDSGSTVNETGTISTSSITGLHMAGGITYSGIKTVSVKTGSGNDFVANNVPAGSGIAVSIDMDGGLNGLIFHGLAGNNQIVVDRQVTAGGTKAIVQDNGQTFVNSVSHCQTIVVYGGTGNNTITMDDSAGPFWSAIFFGGPGNNTLIGNQGNDILVGGRGKNTLIGAGGRNLLLGSAGPDLFTSSGDDLILGAGTRYGQDLTALEALLAEWARTDVSYDDRIDHLRNGGGLNGSYVLNNKTILEDGGSDTISSTGQAWVPGGLHDVNLTSVAGMLRVDGDVHDVKGGSIQGSLSFTGNVHQVTLGDVSGNVTFNMVEQLKAGDIAIGGTVYVMGTVREGNVGKIFGTVHLHAVSNKFQTQSQAAAGDSLSDGELRTSDGGLIVLDTSSDFRKVKTK